MSTKFSDTKLNSADPGDIDFLSKYLTDLSAVVRGSTGNIRWRGLHSVKFLLPEILGHRNARQEPQNPDSDSDKDDESWTEDWKVQDLLEWMLLEARAAGLPEEDHHLVKRLETRLAVTPTDSSDSSSVHATPTEPTTEPSIRIEPHNDDRPNAIYSLPTELLYPIFKSVCSPRSLALFSPLILSHINSHFRSIVLDIPSLWSNIDDILPLPIAKLYLERSKNAPLEIRIGSDLDVTVEHEIIKLKRLFLYLGPHAHRIKTLKVITMSSSIISCVERWMKNMIPFDALENLEYGCCEAPQPSNGDYLLRVAERCSLRELHLWSCPLDRLIETFPITLRRLQLTELAVSFEVLGRALECSPGLSVLALEDCELFGDIQTIFTVEGLMDLQLTRIDSQFLARFPTLIHTPVLASLCVVAPSNTNTDWSPYNNDFLVNLAQSSKKILSAEICEYNLTATDWLSICGHLPNLTHLRVRASYSSDDDLQPLAMAQNLPELTSIILDNELRLTTLLVEQLARAHPKLESIVLRGWDPSNVSADSVAVVNKLVKTVFIETFKKAPEVDCSEESESDSSDSDSSDGSWLSGDEQVAMKGRKLLSGTEL
ncbi:hypothetical protein FRC01_002894 [Tulasnella sp. 417]|nr:hypothetical protein FRC01_002894 [Tulasnella sp. 417]